jgi:tetratricopeptide (TPR) repeat protein
MDDFDEFYEGLPGDGREDDIERFESMLENEQSLFFDLSTIKEIYEFYRMVGEFEKGLKLIDFGLNQYPGEAGLYRKKAELLLELGKPEKAMVMIDKALELNNKPSYVLVKAQVLSALGMSGKAIHLIKELITWTPQPAEAWFNLAAIYNSVHSFKDAAECYAKAFSLDPEMEEALFEQVFCLELSGAIEEGIEVYLKYLDDVPYNSSVWYHLGVLYARIGLHEKAIDAYDFALAISENSPGAFYNKGCSLMELGKFEEAIRIFLEALRQNNQDASTLFSIAECYENLSDTANARYYYRKVTNHAPEMADAWYGIGYSLELDEKYFEAIHYYRKAIGVDEEHYDSWLSLAFCEYHAGNEASAFEALEVAIRINPGDSDLWIDWSMLLKEEGKIDQAMDTLQEGITANPEVTELYYLYAGMCFQKGKSREGMVYLENALIMDHAKNLILFEYFEELKQFQPVVDLIRQYRRK